VGENMTFETLTAMFNYKPIDGISVKTVDGRMYICIHLGSPIIRYIEKEEFSLSPEKIKEVIAPDEDEELDYSVVEFLKSYTYYDRLQYYENDLVVTGLVCIHLNEDKGDDDTLVMAIGSDTTMTQLKYFRTEDLDFINTIFVGRHIKNICSIVNEETGRIDEIFIEFSNGMRMSDFTSFLNQYAEAQMVLTSESRHIYYAFTKDGLVEKPLC
jgi:hypothetical protein